MDGSTHKEDTWSVAGRTFTSRLIVGTGKYKDYAQNAAAAEAAGAEIVTVAVRRVNLSDPNQPMLVDYVKPDRFTFLPNTAGCFTGEDAIRTLRLAREAFRRETYVSLVATGVVSGFGGASYELAVEAAAGLARQSQN